MVKQHDKPLAAAGLDSYRYAGRFGWVMIGASSEAGALVEAARSVAGPVNRDRLQKHDGAGYRAV